MADNFVEFAKGQMGAVEKLIKGLPGIGGYIDKDLRRDADKRVREAIAASLAQSQTALLGVQTALLKGGGLALMDDVNTAIVNLQALTDRINNHVPRDEPMIIAGDFNDWQQRVDGLLRDLLGVQEVAVAATSPPPEGGLPSGITGGE